MAPRKIRCGGPRLRTRTRRVCPGLSRRREWIRRHRQRRVFVVIGLGRTGLLDRRHRGLAIDAKVVAIDAKVVAIDARVGRPRGHIGLVGGRAIAAT